jgi:hypothetical protein
MLGCHRYNFKMLVPRLFVEGHLGLATWQLLPLPLLHRAESVLGVLRQAGRAEKGEGGPGWRVLCPKSHRHVRALMDSWRGLKDGVLKVDADFKFDEWLLKLKGKLTAVWEAF